MKRLLGYMKKYWFMYVCVGVLMLTATSLNAAIPMKLGEIVNTVIQSDAENAERYSMLIRICIMLAAIGIGHAVTNYFKEFMADILGSRIGHDMRRDLFRHIQRLDVGFFDRSNTGELMARIKDDIDKIWFILGFAGMLICEAIIHTFITLGCMLSISPILTILPLIVMVIVAVIALKMEKQLDKCYDALSEQNAKLTTIAQENLSGVRTVKAFAREDYEIDKFNRNNEEYYQLNINLSKVQIKHQPYISLATRMLVLAVVIGGGALIILDKLDYGGLVAFVEYANGIIWPMECIAWLSNELASAVASDRKVRSILREQPVIVDPENPVTIEHTTGHVTFDHVSFAVEDKTILDDVSFDLQPGKTLGVMGMTGTGKTTIINLLERFYDVTGGAVKLDGVDVRELSLSQLRSSVAVVMQDVFLFSDSISENIRMGKRDSISEEDMKKASADACASEFIDKLADDYETIIGERGVGLSGGQKQRISIARALVRKSPVLILDDATSALDMETEYEIQRTLEALSDTTKIIIAHRISAVKDADEIIVLEDGRIAERGTHSQLMALRGRYFDTYVAQYNTEEDMVTVA
ncbi:MAG: ABC transporter ATP-binding protein [Ruminococcaceae bacterium]|nr:ABC transporter ATP-binding protein [Oscillospiraceae bacterium]